MNARDIAEELVRKNDLLAIGTEYCTQWTQKHENCKGCDSELGCGKLVRLRQLDLHMMMYKPTSFPDFMEMVDIMAEKTKAILDAKTVEELELTQRNPTGGK